MAWCALQILILALVRIIIIYQSFKQLVKFLILALVRALLGSLRFLVAVPRDFSHASAPAFGSMRSKLFDASYCSRKLVSRLQSMRTGRHEWAFQNSRSRRSRCTVDSKKRQNRSNQCRYASSKHNRMKDDSSCPGPMVS